MSKDGFYFCRVHKRLDVGVGFFEMVDGWLFRIQWFRYALKMRFFIGRAKA